MDITVYLPDELGERAKEADLPFSRLLRSAVQRELAHRSAAQDMEGDMDRRELEVEDSTGPVTYRVTAATVARSGNAEVLLHPTGSVYVYDSSKLTLRELENPVEELRGMLDGSDYRKACEALGVRPVIDLDGGEQT